MQTLMEGYNIWSIVNGTEAKPIAPPDVVKDWEKRESKAKILLRMLVKDSFIPHIRDISTSKDTWTPLKGLYEITNTNIIVFLKSKLLSIKMEVNENISDYLSRIKELRDILDDIGEQVSNNDLVTVTLNGMVSGYHVFINSLATREKSSSFENLASILLQEEERKKHVDNKIQTADSTLMVKDKKPFKGKQRSKNKRGGKFENQRYKEDKRYQEGASSKSNVKENRNCNYYGKLGHYAYECWKKKKNESKNNKYEGNFVNGEDEISDNLHDLKLFISDVALST
ncbi:hypothetical protein SUGI_0204660 [Cryptomeria japonica]|nr:hypothetical protein SUGI_0204660 [Cryptomeria japonica]